MIDFVKYHGAGNDFIMVDQRDHQWIARTDKALVAQWCHRRFGIGADGLILLQNHPEFGLEMVYFNSDGGESTLCGNGGRCFVAFAKHLGIVEQECRFLATDGPHYATITAHPNGKKGCEWVELEMHDITAIERMNDDTFVLDTGSPHYVRFSDGIASKDMVAEGKAVRYSDRFKEKGINVNFVEIDPETPDTLHIRTYERGVEDETLACGTGVTAAVIAYAQRKGLHHQHYIKVNAVGGGLAVRFSENNGLFRDIVLSGPAERVFEGRT